MPLTQKRERLPGSLSYPATSTDLRAALGDRFVDEEVEVSFLSSPFRFRSRFQSALDVGERYPVIKLTFTRWDKNVSTRDDASARRHLAGFWALRVYPVPRARRAAVRTDVLAAGLPALAAWALRPRPPGWFFGRKVCEVVYDPGEPAVVLVEREEAV